MQASMPSYRKAEDMNSVREIKSVYWLLGLKRWRSNRGNKIHVGVVRLHRIYSEKMFFGSVVNGIRSILTRSKIIQSCTMTCVNDILSMFSPDYPVSS